MFEFLKKEKFKVVACANGKCIPITEVQDQVFSEKMLGDGFAIVPSGDMIVSPIAGTVVTVFPTKHALGIKNNEGVEVLIHIGLDTVNLNGEGFTSLVKEKDKVKAGQSLVKLDRKVFEEKQYNLTTIIAFTSGYDKPIELEQFYQEVRAGELLIE